jgi:hypothetical protein
MVMVVISSGKVSPYGISVFRKRQIAAEEGGFGQRAQ